ncbi:MAG TPA: MFS transporter [Candidatus Limnocylindria bacterium]|nr:MFS transporter [Candidatus Limnocylindria bacterium]
MFLSSLILALIVGALAGGGLPRLGELKLRWLWVLVLALALRVTVMLLRQNDVAVDLPLGWGVVAAYVLIFVFLWGNWRVPGLQVAAVGIAINFLAVLLNGGRMPIWPGAYVAAGFAPGEITADAFHFLLYTGSVAEFVARGGIFGDVVPLPLPVIRDVVSIGDVLLAMGIFWTIVYSMTRPEAPMRPGLTFGPRPNDPFPSGMLASTATPAAAAAMPAPVSMTSVAAPPIPIEREARPQSPYLALVRNRNFGLLWMGQLISFFGDRVHTVAVGVLVTQRGTPLDLGITFAATALPNVFLGPLAGALVDRWDRRRTMIVCDLARAGLVLLVPLAIEVHIALVYAIAFAVATVGLLFRPAKTAIVPALVDDEHLVTANSASTVSETLADVLGHPVAAAIVAALAGLIGAAFVLDAGTYLASALLLAAMAVPREAAAAVPFSARAVWGEMAEGWGFLVGQRELLSNTVISTIAQLAFGAEIVCSFLFAQQTLDTSVIPFPQNYGWLMSALGLGSVVGGLVIGGAFTRARKGPMTIAGFVLLGVAMVGAGLTDNPYLAIGLFFLIGAANLLYLVPTITLFQERTPSRLFGRVVSTRQALTFGAMALSMGLAGWLSGVIGPATVLVLGGAMIAAAGLGGLLVPAMRDAR